jgi:hypothetical protein
VLLGQLVLKDRKEILEALLEQQGLTESQGQRVLTESLGQQGLTA